MGTFRNNTMIHKSIIILVVLAATTSAALDEKSAKSFLKTKASWINALGFQKDNSQRFNWLCAYDNKESWEEMKDIIEESNAPEESVDELERCVDDCDEHQTTWIHRLPVVCQQCFAKIPAGSFVDPNNIRSDCGSNNHVM